MCGSEPDDPDPTASEQILTQEAARTAGEHQRHILPLEQFEIARLQDTEHQARVSSIMQGRGVAEARAADANSNILWTKSAIDSGTGLSSGSNAMAGERLRRAGDDAAIGSLREARKNMMTINQTERLGALETASDLQRSITSGLGDMARQETYAAVNTLKQRQASEMERGRALGSLATTAGAAGAVSYKQAKSALPDDKIGLGGRGLRAIGVNPKVEETMGPQWKRDISSYYYQTPGQMNS